MGNKNSREHNHENVPFYIPQHEIEALARCLLPEIQRFFQSEEGKRKFEEWKREQKYKKVKT